MRVLGVLLGLVVALVAAETAQACSSRYVPSKEQLEHADGAARDGRWTASACGEIPAGQMRRLAERTASAAHAGGCAGSAAGV